MTAARDVIDNRPVLIMAGGTGGHVFPALAVAKEILSRNIPVVWLGTRQGIEARVVPAANIPVEWVSVSGLRGKGLVRLLKAPFMLAVAAWQCFRIVLKVKPRSVLGMGGFVTGPGGVMARVMGKPLYIQEQNAAAGMTNRYLSKIATRVMEAFPESFAGHKVTTVTGNPVRKEITAISDPRQRLSERKGPLRLLVLGGSLGAQALNELVPETIANMDPESRPVVKHQVGPRNYEQAIKLYKKAGIDQSVEILSFIEEMAEVYEWADLVLCRAGALTVSELTCAGIGSVLVPYPHAVDDHQTRNAQFLVNAGAGILMQQHELNVEKLNSILLDLGSNRQSLIDMAVSAKSLAIDNAAEKVADICLQVEGC